MARAARLPARLGLVALTGAALGALIGGVLGRLAMFLLIRLNPEATGVVSDDGFRMGQFTVGGTAELIGGTAELGLVGAIIYIAVRWLLFGPGWFRVVCVALGAGIGVGSVLVHTDGVDFTLLRPAWLAIALFVAIPAAYGAALTLIAENRLLADWPVPPRRGTLRGAPLWVFRGGALGIGVASAVSLLGDIAELT